MKVLIVFFLLFSATCVAQDEVKCDPKIVKFVSENLDSLNQEQIAKFLKNFDASCEEKSELTALSNELLFKVLVRKTDLFLEAFALTPDDSRSQILLELKKPVSNKISVDDALKAVNASKVSNESKIQIIRVLRVAKTMTVEKM